MIFFFAINHTTFLHAPYKLPPCINNIFTSMSFFLSFLFFVSFSLHSFSWACRSLRDRSIFQTVRSLVCSITCSFLNGFQLKLYKCFSNVCSTCEYHTICDWIWENRSKSHILYFEKYQFEILKPL